jgi:hypothetical protein
MNHDKCHWLTKMDGVSLWDERDADKRRHK